MNDKPKQITTNDYIESIDFACFETYSFQRKGNFEIVDSLFKRLGVEEDSLTVQEVREIRTKIKELHPYKPHLNWIFTIDNEINPTAERVYRTTELEESNKTLKDILRIEFNDYDAWMCAPVYRDAILFYDQNNRLIDGLNICFECNNVRNIKGQEILTDRKCYKELKTFLVSLGHIIKS